MKKIGFDLRGTIGAIRGFGRFAFQLLRSLSDLTLTFALTAFVDDNYEQDAKFNNLPFPIVKIPKPALSHYRALEIWEQKLVSEYLAQNDFSLYYSANSVLPLAWPGKRVMQIHDLAFVQHPDWFNKDNLDHVAKYFRASCQVAERVFADSLHTRLDLLRHWSVDEAKIRVLYPGIDDSFQCGDRKESQQIVKEKLAISTPYILTVGTVQPRKNYDLLIDAFADLKTIFSSLHLVIAGPMGWQHEATLEKIRLNAQDITYTNYVPDPLLKHLYRGAEFFVCLSLYEGFGFPVLEAMASGIPVLVADNSSLAEISASAALKVASASRAQVCQAMTRMWRDEELRKELAKKGMRRAREFNWARTAENFVSEIEGVLSG